MKRTTKRCFAVLLAMLMLFSCFSAAVSAADWSGKVYIINYPRSADPNKNGWGHPDLYLMDGWYMKASDKMVMRSIDGYEGPTCYCIEPGISQHTEDTLYQKGEDYWDYYPDNSTISADDISKLIGRILQYGWTGNNSLNWITTDTVAANELAQAKATQILIHEVVVGERRADFSKINAHDYGCNNAAEQVTADCPIYAQIMEHYYRIEAAVQRHTLLPNFGGSEFELGYNNGTYSVTLTDRNNVLGKYDFSSNADVSIQKNGNQLTISTTNPTSESIQVMGKSVGMKKRAFVVWSDGTTAKTNNGQIQDLIQYGAEVDDPLDIVRLTLKVATGNVKIVKDSEDGQVAGIDFHLEGAGVNTDVTTNENGEIQVDGLRGGEQVTITEKPTDKYVQPKSQTVTVLPGQTTSVYFSNILKKFTVTVKKQDSVTGTAQGDATLKNAVYGIYDGDTLIDTYTTDENGSFTSKEYICGDDWTLKELTPSEGYLLDETVHHIGAEPGNFTIEHNPVFMTVTEDVILGQIAIIKHNDNGDTQIETPEVGAEFEVYLKSAGSYAAANDRERDLMVTDENGFDQSKKMPYGVYTVHQTEGNEGTAFIPDFDVVINEHGEVYRYIINNATFESYLKFTKTDAETGKTIPLAGTGVQLYDPQGNLITMSFTYPTPTTIDTFYTDTEGKLVTPEKLPYGKCYKAVEVKAPYGYVLDSTPVYFDVTPETMQEDGGITVVMISKSDMAQKGTIDVTKLGEVFSSVTEEDGIYQPVFALANNKGAEFRITAAEDIVTPDGTVRAAAGTVVDNLVIGDSTTKSKPLYLGKYLVQETKAAHGMVLDTTVYEVTLTYAGQNVSVTTAAITITNARQKAIIDLKKVLEQDDLFALGNNGEILKVKFALYAAEDLTATDGSVIPKDGLLEILSLNEDGTATFHTDLPVGTKTYVKEYSTDEHYILSDKEYPVTFAYAGQDTAEVHIAVNNGEAIENTLIRGDIYGKKVDERGNTLAGAVFGLFRTDVEDFTEETALMLSESDENGLFAFEGVPMGDYVLVELSAPDGYLFDNTPIAVSITTDGQIVEIEAVNTWADGKLIITKSDILDGKLLPNVGFRIRNEQGEIIREGYTDENGVVEFDKLQKGKYTYQEFAAADGYRLDETEYPFEITDEQTVVRINMTNELIPVEIPKTGGEILINSSLVAATVLATAAWITFAKKSRKKK